MTASTEEIGTHVFLTSDFDTAVTRVTAALKSEGFGVLTEIDVKSTLKNRLDVDLRPYKILGACNPSIALRALQATPDVGMLLPCNVTVAEQEDGRILVSIVNPRAMLGIVDVPEMKAAAEDAANRLDRVAEVLSA
jgi:uncharacterized protein (DUF302 family)